MSENEPERQIGLNFGDPEVQSKLLAKLDLLLETQTPLGDRLWTVSDVAIYLATSEPTARRILARPNAPRPIRLPTSDEHKLPARYRPEDIKAFAAKNEMPHVRPRSQVRQRS